MSKETAETILLIAGIVKILFLVVGVPAGVGGMVAAATGRWRHGVYAALVGLTITTLVMLAAVAQWTVDHG